VAQRSAHVLGAADGCMRRFCGETAVRRQGFMALRLVGLPGSLLTEETRSRYIRMLAVRLGEAPVRGLMATCDIIGERSMQYGTYASANS
jgi:hypothetical protein